MRMHRVEAVRKFLAVFVHFDAEEQNPQHKSQHHPTFRGRGKIFLCRFQGQDDGHAGTNQHKGVGRSPYLGQMDVVGAGPIDRSEPQHNVGAYQCGKEHDLGR